MKFFMQIRCGLGFTIFLTTVRHALESPPGGRASIHSTLRSSRSGVSPEAMVWCGDPGGLALVRFNSNQRSHSPQSPSRAVRSAPSTTPSPVMSPDWLPPQPARSVLRSAPSTKFLEYPICVRNQLPPEMPLNARTFFSDAPRSCSGQTSSMPANQPAAVVCEETPPPEMAMWTGVSSAPVSVRAPSEVFEHAPVVGSERSRPSADESQTRIIFSFQSCVPYFECSRFGIEPWSLPDKLSERNEIQSCVAGVHTTVNDAMRPSARAEKRSAARRTGFRPWLTQTPSASR